MVKEVGKPPGGEGGGSVELGQSFSPDAPECSSQLGEDEQGKSG